MRAGPFLFSRAAVPHIGGRLFLCFRVKTFHSLSDDLVGEVQEDACQWQDGLLALTRRRQAHHLLGDIVASLPDFSYLRKRQP